MVMSDEISMFKSTSSCMYVSSVCKEGVFPGDWHHTIQYNKQGRRKSEMIVIMNVCLSGHVTIVLKPQNKIYIIIVARTGGACRMLRITKRIAESIERISIVHTKCPFRREQIL